MNQLSVLLIEDDPITNYINTRVLNTLPISCFIRIASNKEEAIRYLEDETVFPEFIFLEIKVPNLNGIEFLNEFYSRFSNRDIKVIILSTVTPFNLRETFGDYPIHSFLAKPLTEEKIKIIFEASLYSEKHRY